MADHPEAMELSKKVFHSNLTVERSRRTTRQHRSQPGIPIAMPGSVNRKTTPDQASTQSLPFPVWRFPVASPLDTSFDFADGLEAAPALMARSMLRLRC